MKKKNWIFLKVHIKIEKIIIKFGDIEIKKQNFQQHKSHFSIKNIDIKKVVVCNKFLSVKRVANI